MWGTGRADRTISRKLTGGAIMGLAVGVLLLAGCSSDTGADQPNPQTGATSTAGSTAGSTASTPTSAASSAGPSSSPSAGTRSSPPTSAGSPGRSTGTASSTETAGAPGTSAASPPATGSTAVTVPRRTQQSNPPTKKLTETKSTVAPKVTAELTSIRSAQVNSKNPGEISGNAVILGLEVTNGSGQPYSLNNVVVTVAGANGNPGTEITSSPAKPLSGTVKTSGTATGTYVFVVPEGQRNPITVNVTLSADTTIAVFKGDAS